MGKKPQQNHPTTYDIALVRSAATGRWPEILSALGGVDRSILDGKHHPCPKCGGTDRFRMIDIEAGACHCNQCFMTKNGDGFAVLSWLTGKDFGHSLRAIADYLNISPSVNGSHKSNGKENHDPAEHLAITDWTDGEESLVTMFFLPRKPGISIAAIKTIGGRPAMYRGQHKVIAIPVYGPKLDDTEPVGWHLYPTTKAVLPTWTGGKDGKVEWVKSKLTRGSQPGIIGQVDRLKALADIPVDPNGANQMESNKSTIWKCEGPSDVMALIAKFQESEFENAPNVLRGNGDLRGSDDCGSSDGILQVDRSQITITNANGCGEKPAKFTWLFERVAGHNVNVIHDADQPGQAGAAAWATAFATLAGETRNVQLPYAIEPTHGKDLRDWLTTEGNSFAGMMELAAAAEPITRPTAAESSALLITEDDRDPHRLANIFLASFGTMKFWREIFMRFDPSRGCYVIVPRAQLNASINISCKTEFDRLARLPRADDKEPKVNSVSRALVNNVLAALEGICLLPDDIEPNTWLGDDDHARGHKLWISMANGILRLDDLLADADEVLQPHSPLWFSPIALPYEFIPYAECPIFTQVISHNQENDVDRISLLQEWAGYILTPSTDQQKFMVLEGEGANGKSVYLAVLQAMVGRKNVSSIPLESFDGRFDLTQTLGKLLNVAADASEIEKAAEGRVKSFVSGDTMYFDRKGISGVDAQPTARLIVSANNRPRFSDRSSGIWRRMMVVPWNKIIADDDPKRINGGDKPEYWEASGELPGIFWWAVEGLARLRAKGRFTVPAVSASCLDDYRTESNPARAFLLEFYCEASECYVVNKEMYGHYKEWCKENGYHPLSDRIFGREVKRMFRASEKRRGRNGFELEWRLHGIGKSNPQI